MRHLRTTSHFAPARNQCGPGPRARTVVRVRHPVGAIAVALGAAWLVTLGSAIVDFTPVARTPADQPATVRLTLLELPR